MASSRVVTNKVRLSYANLVEPRSMAEGQPAKYSVSVVIPKSDKDTIARINAAIELVRLEGKEKLGRGGIVKLPLRDGDVERPEDAVYANSMFINCNSATKPSVVDADLNAILDSSEIYSGMYGRVSINFFAYNSSGNKGIGAGLGNVQKLEDGEKLGGGASAAQDFGV